MNKKWLLVTVFFVGPGLPCFMMEKSELELKRKKSCREFASTSLPSIVDEKLIRFPDKETLTKRFIEHKFTGFVDLTTLIDDLAKKELNFTDILEKVFVASWGLFLDNDFPGSVIDQVRHVRKLYEKVLLVDDVEVFEHFKNLIGQCEAQFWLDPDRLPEKTFRFPDKQTLSNQLTSRIFTVFCQSTQFVNSLAGKVLKIRAVQEQVFLACDEVIKSAPNKQRRIAWLQENIMRLFKEVLLVDSSSDDIKYFKNFIARIQNETFKQRYVDSDDN